ncbi:MAG: GtrA family protein [Patescibacteria group bacterium]|nr:GtrA family protein [Patescibacteria group bacterium]
MLNINHPLWGQILRFSITGMLNAGVDFGILNLLIKLAGWAPVWANTISFSSAVIVSYCLNKYWTFKDTQPQHLRQFPTFVIVSVVGLGLSNLLVHFGTSCLVHNPFFEISFTWSYNLAKAVSAGIVLIWNFLAYKYLVFKK